MSTAATPSHLRAPLHPAPRPGPRGSAPHASAPHGSAPQGSAPQGSAPRAVEAPHPLLVVTDGRDGALPAVRTAAALAPRLGAAVQAVAALAPLPDDGPALAPLAAREAVVGERELARAAATRDAVRRQLRAVTRGAPDGAPLPTADVAVGRPATTLAALADERHAALVVLPGAVEGALDVARAGTAPVLAVGPTADGTLRRAVVAVDFSPASLRAAGLACQLLAPGGTLSLVHVRPGAELGDTEWDRWDAERDRSVCELFQRLVVSLRGTAAAPHALAGAGRRDVTIGTATLIGDAADELVEYAARVGADLVAVGTHGRGAVERLFVESVAGELVRRAGRELPECSLLVCPELTAEESHRAEPAPDVLEPAEWRLALDGFWRRNDGRRVAVEVDDPALGAQAVTRGFALLGAAFDPHDGRVDLMLGDPGDRRRHLTRSAGDVRAVAVLSGEDGHDVALRIEHGRGRTVVTFLP